MFLNWYKRWIIWRISSVHKFGKFFIFQLTHHLSADATQLFLRKKYRFDRKNRQANKLVIIAMTSFPVKHIELMLKVSLKWMVRCQALERKFGFKEDLLEISFCPFWLVFMICVRQTRRWHHYCHCFVLLSKTTRFQVAMCLFISGS